MKKHENFGANDYIDLIYPGLNETALLAPALNISYHSQWSLLYGYDWVDPRTQQQLFMDKNQGRIAYADVKYSWEDLKKRSECPPGEVR